MKKPNPSPPHDPSDWKTRDLRTIKEACQNTLDELERNGHDISKVRMCIERLDILYSTEFERRCYLEGYSEHLFTQIVMRDSK